MLLLHLHDHRRGWWQESLDSEVQRCLSAYSEGQLRAVASSSDPQLPCCSHSIPDCENSQILTNSSIKHKFTDLLISPLCPRLVSLGLPTSPSPTPQSRPIKRCHARRAFRHGSLTPWSYTPSSDFLFHSAFRR